jgi:protein-L-isoaspartate O-methyltransferase
VTLSGGEPLLRTDLEEIAACFDTRTYLNLNTTGAGLTAERARALRERGIFGMGISLDSTDRVEHDRLRGKKGAFDTAIEAFRLASEAGLYPYAVTVASKHLLEPDSFFSFLRFVQERGGLEVHLLEPCATGNLLGDSKALLADEDRQRILDYQRMVACDESLPILSSFLYLEGAQAFGCGAGLTHLYLDGSGEVCPCNLVPLSFGNVTREALETILERMGSVFDTPRTECVGHVLAPHIPSAPLPLAPEKSLALCKTHLPRKHALPRFFQMRAESNGRMVGREELRAAYDSVCSDYEAFWLSEAAHPIDDLVHALGKIKGRRALEAGCGTGYATALLAERLGGKRKLLAVDLSENMQKIARQRLSAKGLGGVEFIRGDALEVLRAQNMLDLVFSSWVLGYIPLKPFFAAAREALASGGRLAFVVHKENSPANLSNCSAN